MSYREAITRIKQNVIDSEEYERIISRYKRANIQRNRKERGI